MVADRVPRAVTVRHTVLSVSPRIQERAFLYRMHHHRPAADSSAERVGNGHLHVAGGLRSSVRLHSSRVAPMTFRWVLQDTLEPLHERWYAVARGVTIESDVITHLT